MFEFKLVMMVLLFNSMVKLTSRYVTYPSARNKKLVAKSSMDRNSHRAQNLEPCTNFCDFVRPQWNQRYFKVNMPCKYNGNVCGLLGNADQDPTNDNLMPNGAVATSDAELGDSWLVNSFPDFLNLNTAQCEPGVSVTDVEPECPAMDLRSAANVCKMIIDPRLVQHLLIPPNPAVIS